VVDDKRANVFVSFAYRCEFFFFVTKCAETFFIENPEVDVDPPTFSLIWCVVNDQWSTLYSPFTWWAKTFRDAILEIGWTLLVSTPPWHRPEPLLRVVLVRDRSAAARSSPAILLNDEEKEHLLDGNSRNRL
jgi:hypothetical protein